MVNRLTEKIILDSETKSEERIRIAFEKLEKTLLERKDLIIKEFEVKLLSAKENIDKENEIEVGLFRLEKEKEMLLLQNVLIKEVMDGLKKKFNLFIKENIASIITGLLKDVEEKNLVIKVPEASADINIEGVKIVKDANITDSFLLEGKNWKLLFNWERFSQSIEGYIREKIGKELFEDNDKNKTNRDT